MSETMELLMKVCLECMGEGGWTGPVSVKHRDGTDVRVWADCPRCRGRGWLPHETKESSC